MSEMWTGDDQMFEADLINKWQNELDAEGLLLGPQFEVEQDTLRLRPQSGGIAKEDT